MSTKITKTMSVPVESVEKAIDGARKLINNLREIQKSRVIIMEDTSEVLAKRVEGGEKLSDVVRGVERGILVSLIKGGHDNKARLAKVLKTNPDNVRHFLFQRGIRALNPYLSYG